MAWIYLAELEDSRLRSVNGLDQSPIVKTTDTHRVCSSQEYPVGIYLKHQSGTMCKPLKEKIYQELTLSTEASHARTSAMQDLEKAWKESEADYFSRSSGWLGSFDRDSFSWRTSQRSLFEDYSELSLNSQRWGMIVGGRFCQPQQLEPIIKEKDSGYWLTPTATAIAERSSESLQKRKEYRAKSGRKTVTPGSLAEQVKYGYPIKNIYPTPTAQDFKRRGPNSKQQGLSNSVPIGGQLNPTWVEWLMGYPLGWTELGDLVTR